MSYRINKESNELFIYDLMVKKEFSGKGFGSKLIEFAINEAKNENISKIGLWADDINTKAKGLYQKYNFVFQDNSKLQWYNEKGEVILETTSEYMTKTDV
jgi:ribosomal protein S18 acetylase RimI-like enzyme